MDTPKEHSKESVWDYPRPPVIQPFEGEVKVIFNGVILAQSTRCLRVLETSHPPVYYIPPDDVEMVCLFRRVRNTVCPWKGRNTFYDVVVHQQRAMYGAWSFHNPANGYDEIADYIAFYASKMDACFVNGERVIPQPGDLFGGWITSNVMGPYKGLPGTEGW